MIVRGNGREGVSLIRPRIQAWKVIWRVVLFTEIQNVGRGDRYCVCVYGGVIGVRKAERMKYLISGRLNLRFEKYPKGRIWVWIKEF